MPRLTPLGIAQQATLTYKLCAEAAEEAFCICPCDEREDYVAKADLHRRQIGIYLEWAERRGWETTVRHCSTMQAMSEQVMLLLTACLD